MYAAAPGTRYCDRNGPFAPLDGALSAAAIMAYWVNAGGDRNVADQAAAVALAESAGVPNAVNPTDNSGTQTSWGLFQLSDGTHNAPGANWADPQQNASGAVAKYNRAGGTFARDWGTYGGASFNSYLAQIRRRPISNDPYTATSEAGDGTDDNLLEKGINAVTGGAYDEAKHALHVANNIMLIPEHILKNFGPFLIGLMLLAIGGLLLAMSWGDHLVVAAEKFVGSTVSNLDGSSAAPATSAPGSGAAAGEAAAEAAAL